MGNLIVNKVKLEVPVPGSSSPMTPLFEVDAQCREARAIWKMFRTPALWALCNDTWKWFAVNIPMSLAGSEFKGDLDIIVSMPNTFPPSDDCGSRYRVFETKSVLVHADGATKSIKGGKTKKILKQLKKLERFGCQNIFLFEIHVLQAGYSVVHPPVSEEMVNALYQRFETLKCFNFGYLLWRHEPVVGAHEYRSGVFYEPLNMLVPKETPASDPFLTLAKKIEDYYIAASRNTPNRGMHVISYCVHCKELILLFVNDDPRCPGCSHLIL